MASAERESDRRGAPRQRRPLSCEIDIEGERQGAVVVDMSEQGLFVRTNARPPPGTPVRVTVRRPGGEVWEIETQVARASGASEGPLFTGRGLGLVVVSAPEAFTAFVASLG